jgi:hypothetical protein
MACRVLATHVSDEAMRIVFHEYAHLVTANVGRNIPTWLNEGLAEYYSTFEPSAGGREAVIGRPILSHLAQLNASTLLTLDTLLAATNESALYNEGNRRSLFYAQAWALTHMLIAAEPSRRPQLSEFLFKVGEGVPPTDAWRATLGAEPIEKALTHYVRQRSFRAYQYKFPEKVATFEGRATPLAPVDAEAFLADFLLQQERHDEAAARLARGGPGAPASAWATTIAALLDIARGDKSGGEAKLLAIDTAVDWLTGYRAAAGLAEAIEQQQLTPGTGQLAAGRRFFDASSSGGRDIPNAVARWSSLELAGSDPPSTATRTALERAREMAPGRDEYTFLHARVLAEQADFPATRRVLGPLMSPAVPSHVREHARSLMGYIVGVERAHGAAGILDPASPAAAAAPAHAPAPAVETVAPATAAPAEPAASVGAPAAGVEAPAAAGVDAAAAAGAAAPHRLGGPTNRPGPSYPALGPGEQRLEGTLERIDCGQASVVFQVRSGGGLVRVTAKDMPGVAFITYRDDLAGRVQCGPFPGAAPVYVTWRPGTDGGTRIAVAIEFLPK